MRRQLGVLIAALAMALTAGGVRADVAYGVVGPDSPTVCKTKSYSFIYLSIDGGATFTMQQRGCWNGMEAWSEWGPTIAPNPTFAVEAKGTRYNADGTKVTWWADIWYSPSHEVHPTVTLTKSGAWGCHLGTGDFFPWSYCQLAT